VLAGMSSGGNSTGMAAYQHMPNSSGANNTGNMAASVGMHGIGNSPGTLRFISFSLIVNTRCQVAGAGSASEIRICSHTGIF